MKKFFVIAAAALVALAACTKAEVNDAEFQKAQEIRFATAAGKNTKAPITNNFFPHGSANFGVYAAYLSDANTWADNSSSSTLYMGTNNGAGVEVEYTAENNLNIWQPTATYYWPLQGSLTFFGYYPYSLTGASYTQGTTSFSIGSFSVNETVADQVDVLVSSFTADQVANTTTYTDGSVTSSVQGVPIVFKHMLSQVVFTAAAASDVINSGLSFKINNITLGARKTSAGMTVTPGSAPSWTAPTALTPFVASNTDFPASGYLTDTQSAAIGDALLMIPVANFNGQDTTDGNKATTSNDDEYISVTYTLYRVSDDLAMGQKTVKIWLNDNVADVSSWVAGYKYTYQLTIDLEKIYFAPSVTPWDEPHNAPVNVPGNGVSI